jgi:hypothetical protein
MKSKVLSRSVVVIALILVTGVVLGVGSASSRATRQPYGQKVLTALATTSQQDATAGVSSYSSYGGEKPPSTTNQGIAPAHSAMNKTTYDKADALTTEIRVSSANVNKIY